MHRLPFRLGMVFLVLAGPLAMASESSAVLPWFGCPRAHCDGANSDLVRLPAPPAGSSEVWHRFELAGEQMGSRQGLGCSANGTIAACTYAGSTDNLVAYDYDGNRLWSAGVLLNAWAFASAPIVLADGSVIACDNQTLVRFNASGDIVWQSPLVDGGIPISPVLTGDGNWIVLATRGGPVYTFDADSGAMSDLLYVRKDAADAGYFDTINTPAVRGNRVYVVARHQIGSIPDPDNLSRLIAIDVSGDTTPGGLRVAWHYEFGGPSGASPLIIGPDILFDGDRPVTGMSPAPQIIAVRDLGASGTLIWYRPSGGRVVASYARDPRSASFWIYTLYSPWLVRRTAANGAVVQGLNLDALVGEPGTHVPLSAMTIAGPASEPVLLVNGTAFAAGATYLAAVDLVKGTLRWKVPINDIGGWYTAGQFPMLLRAGATRVVFTTYNSGARAIGLQ